MTIKTFSLNSPVFSPEGKIPRQYSCEGDNISPPLAWGEPPENTKSFAIIMEDPGAPSGTYTHWVMFNIPAGDREINEDVPREARLPGGAMQGANSSGDLGYTGPCPPPGDKPHRYHLNIYALDNVLVLNPGSSKEEVLGAMKGHILTKSELTAYFER